MTVKAVKGFTLLEAVVAIAVFSVCSVAIYSWHSTVLLGLARVDERTRVNELSHNVESFLRMQNLQGEAEGEYVANGMTARWRASLVEPKRNNVNIAGVPGHYRVGLYQVDVAVERNDTGAPVDSFSTRIVGYEDIRENQSQGVLR